MRIIDLPPYAPLLMESTRAIGYNLNAAIADILDNSISAQADDIKIRFSPYGDSYLLILDNGLGMDESELMNAMRYGSYNPNDERHPDDLGRFGLGLKTASLSQCRRLTVISKKNNEISACRWDLDYINETGEWSLMLLEYEEIISLPYFEELEKISNGTLVIWASLDKLISDDNDIANEFIEKMEAVRNHLSLVFHRYLDGENKIKKVSIFINNEKLKPIDPFLSKKSQQVFAEESIKIGEDKITVTPYLLPHISNMTNEEIDILGGKEGLRRNQGFYIYRNKRLLIWGDWFRIVKKDELNKLARIKIDIPNSLDSEWTLDVKKSMATPPTIIKKNLRAISERVCECSKRTWTFRGKKETSNDIIHIWERHTDRNGIFYKINEKHPMIDQILNEVENPTEILRAIDSISKYLPINQIYSDLNNDKKINIITYSEEDGNIRNMIDKLIVLNKDGNIEDLLNNLKYIEPFNKFKEIIEEYEGNSYA